ncbi:MAG: hypothetical protein OH338_05005 [Candidatus Parvarchaeota archaeon]|nr:hypothetical protein [Candidatus Parvarchaeum tengchongense]
METIAIHLPREEYKPETVTKFIVSCLDAKGVPMFKTGFAKRPFREDTKRAVMAICYGGKEDWETLSRFFVGVPEEDFKLMKEKVGEWIILLEKYAPEKLKIEKISEVL